LREWKNGKRAFILALLFFLLFKLKHLLSLLAETGLVERGGEEGGKPQLVRNGVSQLQLSPKPTNHSRRPS
jgi:hypothetical protein